VVFLRVKCHTRFSSVMRVSPPVECDKEIIQRKQEHHPAEIKIGAVAPIFITFSLFEMLQPVCTEMPQSLFQIIVYGFPDNPPRPPARKPKNESLWPGLDAASTLARLPG